MKIWNIYYAEREFAREMGDPCLGQVQASCKKEAEIAAWEKGLDSHGVGFWAVEVLETEIQAFAV